MLCDWLEARLPNPVEDESQWKISTDLAGLDELSAQELDELILQRINSRYKNQKRAIISFDQH